MGFFAKNASRGLPVPALALRRDEKGDGDGAIGSDVETRADEKKTRAREKTGRNPEYPVRRWVFAPPRGRKSPWGAARRGSGARSDGSGDGHGSRDDAGVRHRCDRVRARRADQRGAVLAASLAPSFPRVLSKDHRFNKRVRMFLVTHLSAAEASHLTTVLEARDRSSVCFATTTLSAELRANEEPIAAGAAALTETRRAFAEARARTLRVGVARARALPETAFAPARGDAAGATCPRARTVDACMRCSRSDTRACVLECRSRREVRSPGAVPSVVGPSSLR